MGDGPTQQHTGILEFFTEDERQYEVCAGKHECRDGIVTDVTGTKVKDKSGRADDVEEQGSGDGQEIEADISGVLDFEDVADGLLEREQEGHGKQSEQQGFIKDRPEDRGITLSALIRYTTDGRDVGIEDGYHDHFKGLEAKTYLPKTPPVVLGLSGSWNHFHPKKSRLKLLSDEIINRLIIWKLVKI